MNAMDNDNILSQEDIDALLSEGEETPDHGVAQNVTDTESDTLGEIGNISFGSAATTLSELLRQKVEITTPDVFLIERNLLNEEFPKPHVAVHVNYTKGLEGSNLFVIQSDDARVIADLMMDGDGTEPPEEIGEMELSAVEEAMNQMMGTASTSMSKMFNKRVDISPPSIGLIDMKENKGVEFIPDSEELLMVRFNLKIGSLVDSNIMQLLPVDFAKHMVSELMGLGDDPGEGEAEQVNPQDPNDKRDDPAHEDKAIQSHASTRREEAQHLGSTARSHDIQSAVFSDFEETDDTRVETQNLNMLYDIPLQVTVELGRTRRTVKEILRLSPGSVVELDKLAGEPVDIYVNNIMIAKGEVVVIDENFGVRVTEIASKQDRMQKLQ